MAEGARGGGDTRGEVETRGSAHMRRGEKRKERERDGGDRKRDGLCAHLGYSPTTRHFATHLGVSWRELHDARPEHMCNRRKAHGRTRVTRVALLNNVRRQAAHRAERGARKGGRWVRWIHGAKEASGEPREEVGDPHARAFASQRN